MPAFFGMRPPFEIARLQAATTFSQVVRPPARRGMTWSKVKSLGAPQYWQENPSRKNTLKRVKAGWRGGFISLRDTTLGKVSRTGANAPLCHVRDNIDAVEHHGFQRVLPRPEHSG